MQGWGTKAMIWVVEGWVSGSVSCFAEVFQASIPLNPKLQTQITPNWLLWVFGV